MDPQPPHLDADLLFDQEHDVFYAFVKGHSKWHHGSYERPRDMDGAKPMQHEDGKWYWTFEPAREAG